MVMAKFNERHEDYRYIAIHHVLCPRSSISPRTTYPGGMAALTHASPAYLAYHSKLCMIQLAPLAIAARALM
jgi:hypothetical protein